ATLSTQPYPQLETPMAYVSYRRSSSVDHEKLEYDA
ncbi:hypothetical protein Tco_1545698, partial [Tanacetum coccineum]